MRVLLGGVLALGLLWCGYWVVGSMALQKGVDAWFADQAARGKIATSSAVEVHGFPNRFDLTVKDLHLADPVTGVAWDVPFAQVFSMTWKPWHVIAALPNAQTITTPREKITVESSSMMGSVVVVPGTALTLDRIILDGADLVIASSLGWQLKATRAELATRQDASVANGHEVNLTVTGLVPDAGLIAALGPTSDLPDLVDVARLDLVAGFSMPLDRFAAKTKPLLTALTVKDGQIGWGDLVLTTKGTVVAGADGLAEGQIDIHIENWRKMVPVAVAMGLIKPDVAPTVENMMALLAGQSGNGTNLDLPLVMQAGRMSLGAIPLGPAPRMIPTAQG